ncbi:MAG: NAD(P)-binding domain-containing protein [Turicibacter sp.]|nr:NAD(P)-binding domain-containing protein [Turicibacter sp.]
MILIITNDKRMSYLAGAIRDFGMDLIEYHTDSADFDLNALKEVDYLILPFGGIAPDGKIAATNLYLTEAVLAALPRDCVIFTPIKYPKLLELARAVPRIVECMFDYDEVAIYNSIPTAEGVIFNIIKNTEITIHQADILVIGGGRCGQTIARDLKALGARVTVTYRKREDEARLFEMVAIPLNIEYFIEDLHHFDVIVNTVPFLVLDEKALDRVKKDAYIIDIASKPGGTQFEYAKSLGLNAELAGSLPSIVAPKTAAYYLFKFISAYIAKKQKGRYQ